eukprot:NODE_230_length_13723_cov_0.393570.p9 type:complete len:117 gc:universal NODE_230_length_13723_cov_0.393570:5501-5851(+)
MLKIMILAEAWNMFYMGIFGILLKREYPDYTPVYLPLDGVYIADTADYGNLTLMADESSIESLFAKSNFTLPFSNTTNQNNDVHVSEIQSSQDSQLNQFLIWSNCGNGLLVDFLTY